MPKKNKTLCVDDLRHAEYYGMQPVFDELYHRSLEGENFTDLMDLILSRDNILLAYRNIKANYDYGICGFLSYGNTPYPGNVHIRPEILLNIDDLLQTNLSDIWEKDHHTYEVIAQTDSDKIILDDDNPMMAYLVRAFWSAFWTNESLILLKPNIDVLPTDILEIKKFNRWKDNV